MAITRATPVAASGGYFSNNPSLSNVTIPAGALCVVFVTSTSSLSHTLLGTADVTIHDTGSRTWTRRAFAYNHDNNDGYPSSIWVYEWFNGTGSSVTTTITTDYSALAYNPGAGIIAQILAGAKNPGTYTPQVAMTTAQALPQVSIAPSYNGSLIVGAFADKNGTGPVVAMSGSVIDTSPSAQFSGAGLVSGAMARASAESTFGSVVTMGGASPSDTHSLYTCVAIEYYDASATPATVGIDGNLTVPITGTTTLTATSTSALQKTYSWAATSGIGGTFSDSTAATTIFTPSALGATIITCQITDPSEISYATATVTSIENHYRIRSGGAWTNPRYFNRVSGAWLANVHSGLSTGGNGVSAANNDGRAYTATILADSPAVYYAMQEVGGTAAIDWSGHASHGAYVGGVQADFASNPYLYPPVALGRTVYAANIVDNLRYIAAPAGSVVVSGGLSLEIWINAKLWNYYSVLFYLSDAANDGTDVAFYHDNNAQNLILRVSSTTLAVPYPDPDTGGWHHVVATIPAGGLTANIYIDGALAGSGIVGALASVQRSAIHVGRANASGQSAYCGYMTQAAFYGRQLTSNQVQAHYAAGMADADPVWHGPAEWYDPLWYSSYTGASALAQRSYVPVADWMTSAGFASEIAAESPYFDISINPRATDYSWFRQASMHVLPSTIDPYMSGTQGSETVGYFTRDESDMLGADGLTQLQAAGAALPAGYFGYANFGTLMSMGLGTPNISPRVFENTTGVDVSSTDMYWYATNAAGTPEAQYWQIRPDQVRRACNYGAVVERQRSFQTNARPLWAYVELAHPNNFNIYGGPNPNQVEGAVWGAIIGGARGIIWFHHSFAQLDGGGHTIQPQTWNASTQYSVDDCVFYNGTYYYAALLPSVGEVPAPSSYTWVRWSTNSGAGIRTTEARHPDLQPRLIKIKADLQAMASAINSPTTPHLCHKNIYSTYRLHALDRKHYIIAVPGLNAPQGGTFAMHLPVGQSPSSIEVVGENRSITPSGGTFTDTFDAEYSHHIYRW